ncbi:hypothetical protein GCM10025868_29610 [Angustibacter aerolatus]|uniref:Dihydroneopterin aldolase/epimerase domain-containing protein n=1 Tax=Angustibacter aerolatus TaxID=1162965 RepID=A0ABQ6JLR1_9ACTN|nr:hypothetical protein GCM10025868_29610 [Angustibacter aerolatus]
MIEGEPVDLVETVAQRVADVVLQRPDAAPVVAVDVAVHKPAAPVPTPFTDVVVRVRRWRG